MGRDDRDSLAEGEVAGQRDAGLLLAFGQDLEQQLGTAGVELNLAELVDPRVLARRQGRRGHHATGGVARPGRSSPCS